MGALVVSIGCPRSVELIVRLLQQFSYSLMMVCHFAENIWASRQNSSRPAQNGILHSFNIYFKYLRSGEVVKQRVKRDRNDCLGNAVAAQRI